jgi:hypothetical protein
VALLPPAEVILGLLLVASEVLPLGLVLVRLGEKFVGRRVRLSSTERFLLAIYAAGGLLFLVASIPAPLYGLPEVAGLLLAGFVAYAVLAVRERGAGLRSALQFARSVPGLLLIILTLGLLLVEVIGVANLRLSNGLDGSVYSLFVNLLTSNHTIPWTLNPYAPVGVTYPQAAPVWMSLPVLLLGWPIVSIPLVLPALFLSFSALGAYCLGERLSDGFRAKSATVGLLFAFFFALVASWPRLWVGGSYDFGICLPLFLVVLGWLVPFVALPLRPWKDVIAFGVVIGIATSLSAMIGFALVLLLFGFLIVFRAKPGPTATQWAFRWMAICGLAALSVLRSLVGVAVWFTYPGHVLTPVGNPPPAPVYVTNTLSYRNLTGALDPFVLFKAKLSPFPWQSLEIAALLAGGLALLVWLEVRPAGPLSHHLPRAIARPIVVGTITLFAVTAGACIAGELNTSASGPQSLVNIQELSTLLFIFYELIALLPLLAALSVLGGLARASFPSVPRIESTHGKIRHSKPTRERLRKARFRGLLLSVVLLVPLVSGAVGTVVQVPGAISHTTTQEANISQGDISALQWAGNHLATCSIVLVAPGSVGQYLPEYADVGIVFPAFPTPVNLSYYLVVQDFQNGVYTNATRAHMLELGVTEVFVSGQTTVTFPPFLVAPLERSSDFSLLFASEDAAVFEFLPGALSASCLP